MPKKLADNWVNKPGFPILDIKIISWKNKKLEIEIEQTPFHDEDNILWEIPIQVRSGYIATLRKRISPTILMKTKKIRMRFLNISDKTGWIHFNSNSTEYYVVHYPEKLFDLLLLNKWPSEGSE